MRWKDLDFKLRAELIKLGVLSGIRDINLIRLLYDELLNTVSDVLYLNNKVSLEQLSTRIYDKGNNYETPLDSLNNLELIIEGIQLEIVIEQIKAEQPELFKRDRLGVRINERPVPAMMDSSRVREDLSQRYDDIRKRVLSYKKYRAYGGYIDKPPFLQRILNNDNRSVVNWENNKQKATHKLSYAETPEGYIVYPEVQEVNGELHDFTDPKYKHGKWDALDNAIKNNDTLRFFNELGALRYTLEYKQKYPDYFKLFDKGEYILNNSKLSLINKVNKFEKGGYEDENKDKNKNFKTIEEVKDEPKVSKNYLKNFPNLVYVMTHGRGENEDYQVKRREKYLEKILNNFTENDSIFYTPILLRIENIVPEIYNLNTNVSKALILNENILRSKILIYGAYKHAYPYNEDYKHIHNILNNTTDEEIIKVLYTDLQKATPLELMNIKPKKVGLLDLLKAYNIMENKNGGYLFNTPIGHKVKKYEDGGPIKKKKENSLEYRLAIFNNVDPREGYPSPITAIKYYLNVVDKMKEGDTSKNWKTDGSIGDATAEAAWAKYLKLPYDTTLLPTWNGDTVRLTKELENQIPIDTNFIKQDIENIKMHRDYDRSMGIFDREDAYRMALNTRKLTLDNLRKTYKTGEWVQMNEFMFNDLNPFDYYNQGSKYKTPLNVLLNFGLRYDKNTNSIIYGDKYDLNKYDYFLPGNPFIIRGSIPLEQKYNGGFIQNTNPFLYRFDKGGYNNPDEPPVSESTYVLQPPLNIYELEILNYLLSNPTVEQEYSRNLAILNMTAPQSNLGVILTKELLNIVDKAFLRYNNFRYSHPWANGLNWTPIIGDGMDLISLAGGINNKNYTNAAIGLGLMALPNFILKPISYGKINMLKKVKNKTWDKHYSKALLENDIQEARKLFNLHLKAKTPKGYQNTILYHGSRFGNIPHRIYPKSPTRKTYGFYMSPDKNYAAGYLKPLGGASINRTTEPIELTLTYKNMYTFPDYNLGYAINSLLYKNIINLDYDSGITFYKNKIPEYIAFNPNLVKSNNLITYNNSNKVIPLSKRHDFNKPDIRYSWLIPTIPFGLISYKLFNQNNKEEYKNGGYLSLKGLFLHKF